ncbi:aldehyde dehydrogenase [Salicibibacter cibarius]|uniref:Aldehyde dehydrogenase n=1 Tax=Salicibibacter cibarius TaxID=2743000 RepID=A0A7T6Z4C3_9BACI|nr:aldehyde dehydrogenase family protein [Salicibibacter cibarius]QQK76660.1 aldehyde dehydrogenase [Salicibibacter cibarius]
MTSIINNILKDGNGNEHQIKSPGSGELLGKIKYGDANDVNEAVQAASHATKEFSTLSIFERTEILVNIAGKIQEKRMSIAELLSKEHGKPLYTEALGEVDSCITSFRDAASQMNSITDEIIPLRDSTKRAFAYRKPRGVYAVITPWNFPIGNACTYYIAPGLAAGNTIVWTPAPSCPNTAQALMECVIEAGMPEGALNLVIGEGPVVGDTAVTHELTNAIGFTGSTKTGEIIAQRSGIKPCLLELGGNGPSIVMQDANINQAAKAIAAGSFVNAGQVCTSTERVLVHDSVADELIESLQGEIKSIVLGDPLDKNTTMGPVHNDDTVKKIMTHIRDAVDKGARLVTGGSIDDQFPTSLYVKPTLIDRVSKSALINTEETFGPVIGLVRYKTEFELDEIINSSPYRLSGSIFSEDIRHSMLLAEKLNFGFININEASNYWEPQVPAGGASGSPSGYDRSGGKASIENMSETQTIVVNMQ